MSDLCSAFDRVVPRYQYHTNQAAFVVEDMGDLPPRAYPKKGCTHNAFTGYSMHSNQRTTPCTGSSCRSGSCYANNGGCGHNDQFHVPYGLYNRARPSGYKTGYEGGYNTTYHMKDNNCVDKGYGYVDGDGPIRTISNARSHKFSKQCPGCSTMDNCYGFSSWLKKLF